MKIKIVPFLLSSLLLIGCSNSFNTPKNLATQINNNELIYDVWDGTISLSFSGGQGTISNPYKINSASDLAYLQNQVANGQYYQGSYFELNCNIDLNNLNWDGIGNGYSSGAFKGNLNGKNYEIKNININATDLSRKGFFNSNSGLISNLNLKGKLTGGSSNATCLGLFAGINYGDISNCSSSGNVDVLGNYVAGFIGCNAGGNLSYCSYLDGNTTGSNLVGGVIGYNMVSSGKIGNLDNCKNYGNISAKDYLNENYSGIGGIVATCGSGANIVNCINYGDVIGEGNSVGGTGGIVGNNFNTTISNCSNEGYIKAYQNVGGIIGYSRNPHNVSGCVNKGTIEGDIAVAGIVGYNRTKIYNSINEGVILGNKNNISYWIGGIAGMNGSNVVIEQCNNKGSVYGKGSSSGGVGGIAGSNYSSTISYCTNEGYVEGLYRIGGILGYSQTNGGFVLNCINVGNFATIATFGTVSLGGIVGYNQASVIGNKNSGNYIFINNGYYEMYGYIIGFDTVGSGSVYNNINEL